MRRRRWRWPWWAWLVLAATVAAIATASVLATLANGYQPLLQGGTSTYNLAYPGLPAAHGIRTVNTFGGICEDLYLPPQRGVFYLFADVANGGSRAVVIESVSLPKNSELRQAGQTRYARPGGGNGAPAYRARDACCTTSHSDQARRSSSLSPPVPGLVRPSSPSVAALPWGMQDDMLIMHFPAGRPGEPGVFCVS